MKTAVVLFNLGGPDRVAAVRPFLFNLFNDKAILRIPQPLRWALASVISRRRRSFSENIYRKMGGASPLLPQTREQAAALEAVLNGDASAGTWKTFIAMRYWHPMTGEAAEAVKAWGPDRVILMPLYPQYSTTTTGSSVNAWNKAVKKVGLDVPTRLICCYPQQPDFIEAHCRLLSAALAVVAQDSYRVLFSAHGLPERIIKAGDPYQWQVECTVSAIAERMSLDVDDYVICYQSRVGPVRWIGPATEDEIRRAGAEGKAVVLVPVAFVSEHSETLVELDMDYRDLAAEAGVPVYQRVPTIQADAGYIAALSTMIGKTEALGTRPAGDFCPERFSACACREVRK